MANKNEAKIRFTAETSGFNEDIKKSNKTMAELRAELKLNEEQMKTNGTSVEGLEKKQEILGKQLEASEDKTKALSQKVEKAVKLYGENSDEVSKLRIQLMNAQAAEEKIRQQINKCNDELEKQAESTEEVEETTESLTDKIERQRGELDDLKGEYAETVAQHGKNSKEAKELAEEIQALSSDLKDNQLTMNRAEKAADELDETMDDVGDSAEDAGDGFTVMKGALANLVSTGIQSAISGIANLASSFLGLAEETKETRTQLSLLYNAFGDTEVGVENATDTLYGLQGILGDMGTAVEASMLLRQMSDNSEELETNVRILTGVFAEYGQSIPTTGLAEAISATSSMGSVQGVLADALEWQGHNLDDFNAKLEELSTKEERASFIQETLIDIYGESADKYRENNEVLIEANETQLRYNEGLAELGEKAEPITTEVQKGFAKILESVTALVKDADFESIRKSIENAFQWLVDDGIPSLIQGFEDFVGWLKDAKTWADENTGVLIALGTAIGIVSTAIGAYNVVNGIKAAMDAAQVTTIWGLVAAHWAQATAAMAAVAPYILIVAAIAAVIAIIVVCIKYWDEIVVAVKKCWDAVCATLSKWGTWIDENVIQPIVGFFTGLWDGIVGVFQGVIDWVKTNWQAIVLFILNPFAGIFKYLYDNFEGFRNLVDNVVNAITQFFVNLWNKIVEMWHTVIDPWIEIVKRLSVMFYENVIQPIAQFFTELWNGIVSGLQTAWNWIVELALTVAGWVNENVIQPVAGFFTELWNGITAGVTNAIQWVKDVFATISGWVNEKVIQPVTGFFTKLWDGFTSGARKAWDGVKSVFSKVGEFFSNVFGIVKDKIVSVFQAGGKVFNNIKEGIVSVFKTVVNGIIKGINTVVKLPFKGLNKILDKIHNVEIVGVRPFDWLTWRAPLPEIPLLAKGGILTKPTLNIAGEAGPEAIIPIDKLNSFISGAVEKAMQTANLQALAYAVENLANRPIILEVNGRQLATAIAGDGDVVNGQRTVLITRGLTL